MNNEIKQKWVDALRSGEYQQGRHQLRNDDSYCCLGVLCDLFAENNPEQGKWYQNQVDDSWFFETDDDRFVGSLPVGVAEWAQLDDINPPVKIDGGIANIASVNDHGVPFDKIAQIIEEQL